MSDIDGAAAQLRRVLFALAKLDDDKAHALTDIARAAGTDEATIFHDLRTLVNRDGGEPAGFVETVSLAVDATTVRLEAPGFFRRPMGLTRTELHALELGLATLRQELPPDEQRTIENARKRLMLAIAGLPGDATFDASHAAELGAEPDDARRAMRKDLRLCITAHRFAEINYQKAEGTSAEWRTVRPIGCVFARGSWYLVALGESADEVRMFRFDRIHGVRVTPNVFAAPLGFSLDSVVQDGRVMSEQESVLRIRYSARIARWIAERESQALDADGTVTVEYPLADPEWAVRFVLRYGAEAEVISPPEVREMVRERLRGMLAPN